MFRDGMEEEEAIGGRWYEFDGAWAKLDEVAY